jgi:mono/diheme cytochrome c family protein
MIGHGALPRVAVRSACVLVLTGLFGLTASAAGQSHMPHMDKGTAPTASTRRPPAALPDTVRITMDALHAAGGVPRGWTFLMPRGDAADGRKVCVAMECFACHAVGGEDFPRDAKTPSGAGPELTGMGSHHPAEYFAESILSPNRVIVLGPGFTGSDGLSKMPSYADTMTLKQLTDLVAYLKSLTAAEMDHAHHHMGGSGKPGGAMKMK